MFVYSQIYLFPQSFENISIISKGPLCSSPKWSLFHVLILGFPLLDVP